MDLTKKMNATQLLGDGHRAVEELHQRFRAADNASERAKLAEELLGQLEIHGRLEECLAYPELGRTAFGLALTQRFGQEHGEIKRLISEFRLGDSPDQAAGAERDELIARIMARVDQHVDEEETEAFPILAADPGLDQELGAALARLKAKLDLFPPIHPWIDVEVPVRMAYNQWTQFETFPGFLDNVKEVRQLDATHVRWEAEVAGKSLGWTAEIHEQIPDRRIAWRSVEGTVNAGSVTFRPLTPHSTRVLLEVAYEPQGLLEDLGAMLGLLSQRMTTALAKFKGYLESRPQETGAWRGRIEGKPGQPPTPGRDKESSI